MATNFPNSPNEGDIHQVADRVWQWDGEKWKATGTTSSSAVGAVVVFEGATADAHETTLTAVDPTADRTITLPNATGTVALTSDLTTYAPLASPALTGGATITSTDTTVTNYGPTIELCRDGTHGNDYPIGRILFTGDDENDAKQRVPTHSVTWSSGSVMPVVPIFSGTWSLTTTLRHSLMT